MIQGLSLRVMEFLTVFIGQQILYCLENVDINSLYAVSTSADLNTLSPAASRVGRQGRQSLGAPE